MKKILAVLVACLFMGGVSMAATQYNNVGAIAASSATFSGGLGLWNITAAQELVLTPATTGQLIFCTNCAKGNSSSSGKLGMVCVSTGSTAPNQFIAVSSFTAVTACQ